MATGQMSGLIQYLRRTMLLGDMASLTDGQLLKDYLRSHDEETLAVLVQRHAAMVWGVCQRVLGNYHDAEDAFQAAFLVLVRRAASITSPDLLANWLYGVAHQTALKARAKAAKKKVREKQVIEMPESAAVDHDHWNDLQPLLDQELSRLPEIHRAVIVLCDLQGKARKEAARHLGLSEGTVGSRLARARATLAKRLKGRGVTLSAGTLAAVLAQNVASAGAPFLVVSNAIRAASLHGAGKAAAAGLVSLKVVALAEGVLKAMLLSKLKAIIVMLLVVGFITTGTTILSRMAMAETATTMPTIAGEGAERPTRQQGKPVPGSSKDKAPFTAWGKEIGGLQAGLGFRPGEDRIYHPGETATLAVRVRNVGKKAVNFQYLSQFFVENPTAVMDGQGKRVPLARVTVFGFHLPRAVNLAPGKEIELYELKLGLLPANDPGNKRFQTIHGTGKFQIQYERVLGKSSSGTITLDPVLSKLATGKLELEIRSRPPPVAPKEETQAADEPARDNPTVTLQNVTIDQVDDRTRTVSFSIGKKKTPTKLLNIPMAEKVRVVASHRLPGSANNLPFRWEQVKMLQGKVVSVRFIANPLGILVESISAGNDAPPQAGKTKPVKILVWIEKLNADSRSVTASCMRAGAIPSDMVFQRLENLSISKIARIKHKGRDIAFADLKPRTGAFVALDSSEGTLIGTGLEGIRESPPDPEDNDSKQEKEGFTAWGKEIGGVQAGLGFRLGEPKTSRHNFQ